MNTTIILRTFYAVGIVAAGITIYWSLNRLILIRAKQKYRGLENRRPNIPTILYFTTPTCAPCKTIQRPALQRLQAYLGPEQIQIIEIDATAHPDLADYWGVLSVPTTFIIDSKGQPRRVNHGVVRAEKLHQQLALVAADSKQQRIPVLELARRIDP